MPPTLPPTILLVCRPPKPRGVSRTPVDLEEARVMSGVDCTLLSLTVLVWFIVMVMVTLARCTLFDTAQLQGGHGDPRAQVLGPNEHRRVARPVFEFVGRDRVRRVYQEPAARGQEGDAGRSRRRRRRRRRVCCFGDNRGRGWRWPFGCRRHGRGVVVARIACRRLAGWL